MKGLIVDDEAKGRSSLKRLCHEFCDGLEIIGEADSVSSAEQIIEKHQPNIVFLDIRMPVNSGFVLLEKYNGKPPFSVIFTTAYEEYALRAFKEAATDYLLKPIEIDMLVEAYKKALKRHTQNESDDQVLFLERHLSKEPLKKIAIPIQDGYAFVRYADILRCEAQGNYTMIYLVNGRTQLITKTLKHYEQILSDKSFFRIHKSHLINLRHVRKFLKSKNSQVEMKNGVKIEVSPLKKEALLDLLTNSQ